MKKIPTVACFGFLLHTAIGAQTIGLVQTGGSGCPPGTTSVAFAPDNQTVTLLFDEYSVATDSNTSTARKGCVIAFPIQVPIGQQVRFVRADYRGFYDLPNGTESRFSVEYFLAGSGTTPYVRVLAGPLSGNYLLSDVVDTTEADWSRCSESVTFRINSGMTVYKKNASEDAMAVVDSADITLEDPTSAMAFYFVFRSCNAAVPSGASMATAGWLVAIPLALLATMSGF